MRPAPPRRPRHLMLEQFRSARGWLTRRVNVLVVKRPRRVTRCSDEFMRALCLILLVRRAAGEQMLIDVDPVEPNQRALRSVKRGGSEWATNSAALKADLLANYPEKSNIAPPLTEPVSVQFKPISINDIDTVGHTFSIYGWWRIWWSDERLRVERERIRGRGLDLLHGLQGRGREAHLDARSGRVRERRRTALDGTGHQHSGPPRWVALHLSAVHLHGAVRLRSYREGFPF